MASTATTRVVPVGMGDDVTEAHWDENGALCKSTLSLPQWPVPGACQQETELLASSCPQGSVLGRARSHLPMPQGEGSKGRKLG